MFAQDQDDSYHKDSVRMESQKQVEVDMFYQQRKLMELKLEIEKKKLKEKSSN